MSYSALLYLPYEVPALGPGTRALPGRAYRTLRNLALPFLRPTGYQNYDQP